MPQDAGVARAQSRAVANERLAAIGKMAAHVTHEIRNPLSSIGLNIELLEEELAKAQVIPGAGAGSSADTPSEARSLLEAITREVQRLEHLSVPIAAILGGQVHVERVLQSDDGVGNAGELDQLAPVPFGQGDDHHPLAIGGREITTETAVEVVAVP